MEQSYKEKYEDILARLERAKNDNDVCDERFCCVINDIIPELAESEEEKIKKRTTLCLEECVHSDVIRDYEKDECIAWLEKQGQVKESFISQHENRTCKENDDSLTSEDERIRKALLEMVHDTTGDELWADYDVHKEEAIAWLEKQGEQKTEENKGNIGGISPNWSEEDKDLLYDTLSNLTELKDRYGEGYGNVGKCIDWVKSLKGRRQPKQEWNEEDINMIDWLIRCCKEEHKELCNDKYGHQDIVSDLKRDCRKKWDWLKSLKNRTDPQNRWEPSEAQMDSITCAVRKMKESACYDSELVSLFNDLKKLKEE